MFILQATTMFINWYSSLKDSHGKAKIRSRLKRLKNGYLGDTKSTRQGNFEMRIHGNNGYRIYFARGPENRLLLLLGGDKRRQHLDMKLASKQATQGKFKAFYL